jgi:anthranilate synthase component II
MNIHSFSATQSSRPLFTRQSNRGLSSAKPFSAMTTIFLHWSEMTTRKPTGQSLAALLGRPCGYVRFLTQGAIPAARLLSCAYQKAGMEMTPNPKYYEMRSEKVVSGLRVLIIDNYDSFTFNLAQHLGALGAHVEVARNDFITPDQALNIAPDRILISPGPGTPDNAGISRELIKAAAGKIPLLGVCLGHQCLGEVFGGRTICARPMHGKVSVVHHDGKGIFRGLKSPMPAARYHSLVIDPANLDQNIEVSARTGDGLVMGLRHRAQALEGIQFHPESFMTPHGAQLIKNFLLGTGES